MKIKIFFLCLTLFIGICCSFPAETATSPEEQAYLAQVMDMPLEFRVPKENAEEAWGRIQSFIGKYSSMKIQVATDYVIETYNPGSGDVDYGYSVSKTIIGDEVEFSVNCFCGNMFSGNSAKQNAHILAYYAKTGELIPRLISK